MTSAELLVDAVGRIRGVVHRVVDSLTPEQLAFRVDPKANSIAWLVWHLTRIQDDHVADVAQAEQVWTSQGWVERFGLPFDPGTPATGTGPMRWRPCRWSPASCWWATMMRSTSRRPGYVERLGEADLARIVDRSWDPPVSLSGLPEVLRVIGGQPW
jgi:Protein of unknown function (DUF664)